MKWLIIALILLFPLRRWFLPRWYMVIPAIIGAFVASKVLQVVYIPPNMWYLKPITYAIFMDLFAQFGKDWYSSYR